MQPLDEIRELLGGQFRVQKSGQLGNFIAGLNQNLQDKTRYQLSALGLQGCQLQ